MYAAARSLLFKLDAERAHELTLEAFRRAPKLATLPFAQAPVADPLELLGLRFANRVGLAAGLDKNGECLEAWGRLGFGFVEVGTVTPRAQPGNPKPRMFRLPEHQAIINRLGFNNKGVDPLLARVAEARETGAYRGVLGINIGKNFDTPIEKAADDYLICLRKVYRAASYVTVNISSPNTQNLRELQSGDQLRALLCALKGEGEALAQQHGKRTPIVVKIAPDVDDGQLDAIAIVARETGIDGLIATNTTIARDAVAGHRYAGEAGGLSGAPLKALADRTLAGLRARVGRDFVLIGVGGISDEQGARDKLAAGADLVQIYSGFIYRGPALVRECAAALRDANPASRLS